MKNGFLKRLCAASLAVMMTLAASEAVLADVIQIDLDEFLNHQRLYKQNFSYVDLRSVTNRAWADDVAGDGKGGWSDQGPSNDMSCMNTYGIQTMYGINFDIINPKENNGTSCIMLKGMGDTYLQTDVTIPVNAKAKGIYFLHTAPWASDKFTDIGTYTIVFADGSEDVIKVSDGDNVFNWWGEGVSDHAVTVWTGNNSSATVGLDMFPYSLGEEKEIKEIKVHTNGETTPYLGIAAITLTDTDPYLPAKKPEDIGNPDVSEWFPYIDNQDAETRFGTAIDASNMLEKPSGTHGHVTIDGDKFIFEDGTEFRMWGTVIGGTAVYPTHEEAEANAKMLALQGFNTVRFHATSTGINSNVGYERVNSRDRQASYISPDSMDRLAYFISELKKNGIYYGMDLTPAPLYRDNDVKYFDQISGSHALHWFDPDTMKRRESLAKQWLTWKNPYTGLSIAEDPSAIWVSYCNECSIFKNNTGPNNSNDYYRKELQNYYNEWLREKYPSREALEYAWYDPSSDGKGLEADEDPYDGDGTVKVGNNKGERKMFNSKRDDDNIEFFIDVEQKSIKSMQDSIHEYAPKLLVHGSTTCLTGDEHSAPLYSAAKAGQFVSYQCYWYLPNGNGERMAKGTTTGSTPPVSSMTKDDKFLGMMGYLAARKVYGEPYLVTEWDASQPNPWRCENNLEMIALTCQNRWNPFWFAWQNVTPDLAYNTDSTQIWNLGGHQINRRPEAIAVMPILARMLHRGDIKEAEKGYYVRRFYEGDAEQKKGQTDTFDMRYSVAGQSSVVFDDIAFDENYTDNDVIKLVRYGEKTGEYMSYLDQIKLDYNKKIFYVNTDRTQAIAGYIGKETTELDDVIFDMDSQNNHGSVYLQSLTDDAITDSEHLIFVYAADARNTGQEMSADGRVVENGGKGPVQVQPMYGRVTLKSKDNYVIYLLDENGKREGSRTAKHDENGLAYFDVNKEDRTFYYEIERTSKSNSEYTPNKITFLPEGIFDDMFTDLGKYEPYKKEIERTALENYIKPMADKEFFPEQPLTRGEAVKLLSTIFKFVSSNDDPGFTDVKKGHLYYDEVAKAAAAGMINGYGTEAFRPDDAITKEDFLTMVYRGIKTTNMLHSDERGKTTPNLSNVSDYAKEAVEVLTKRGYCDEINSLNLKDSANRAEAAVMVYRILWE